MHVTLFDEGDPSLAELPKNVTMTLEDVDDLKEWDF